MHGPGHLPDGHRGRGPAGRPPVRDRACEGTALTMVWSLLFLLILIAAVLLAGFVGWMLWSLVLPYLTFGR